MGTRVVVNVVGAVLGNTVGRGGVCGLAELEAVELTGVVRRQGDAVGPQCHVIGWGILGAARRVILGSRPDIIFREGDRERGLRSHVRLDVSGQSVDVLDVSRTAAAVVGQERILLIVVDMEVEPGRKRAPVEFDMPAGDGVITPRVGARVVLGCPTGGIRRKDLRNDAFSGRRIHVGDGRLDGIGADLHTQKPVGRRLTGVTVRLIEEGEAVDPVVARQEISLGVIVLPDLPLARVVGVSRQGKGGGTAGDVGQDLDPETRERREGILQVDFVGTRCGEIIIEVAPLHIRTGGCSQGSGRCDRAGEGGAGGHVFLAGRGGTLEIRGTDEDASRLHTRVAEPVPGVSLELVVTEVVPELVGGGSLHRGREGDALGGDDVQRGSGRATCPDGRDRRDGCPRLAGKCPADQTGCGIEHDTRRKIGGREIRRGIVCRDLVGERRTDDARSASGAGDLRGQGCGPERPEQQDRNKECRQRQHRSLDHPCPCHGRITVCVGVERRGNLVNREDARGASY